MSVTAFFLLLLSWALLAAVSLAQPNGSGASPFAARGNSRNVPPQGFYDPRDHNGTWLTVRLTLYAPSSSVLSSFSFSRRERQGKTRKASVNNKTPNLMSLSFSKSTILSPPARVNLSTSFFSDRPTLRSWLTNKLTGGYATIFCTFLSTSILTR